MLTSENDVQLLLRRIDEKLCVKFRLDDHLGYIKQLPEWKDLVAKENTKVVLAYWEKYIKNQRINNAAKRLWDAWQEVANPGVS